MATGTYRVGHGLHQRLADELQALASRTDPLRHAGQNPALAAFQRALLAYCNRGDARRNLAAFGSDRPTEAQREAVMHRLILAAAAERGLLKPVK
jgi:hypothetical protein